MKQARHDELMSQISQEKRAELELQKERNEATERRRKYQLNLKKDKEEDRKNNVWYKIEEGEASLQQLKKQRRNEQMLIKAERTLQQQTKRENLNRIKRKQQYHMKETMRKVEENDRRSQELKKQKENVFSSLHLFLSK